MNTRRFGVAAAAMMLLAFASSAHAAVLSSAGGSISYIAGQGERNDVLVSVDSLLGQTVYSFKDNDATPIGLGGGLCELVNGVGMCTAGGVAQIVVNARDRDDTITVSTGGPLGPVRIASTLIGGRGVDVLMGGNGRDRLKGNNGRDSLRGRRGADVYKGGRGSDVLQTLDGKADVAISCGPGARDLVRADKADPPAKNCELGKQAKRSKKK